MECIICKERGREPLIDNTKCSCKYKIHISCWIDYVHSTQKVKCILCRQEIPSTGPPPPRHPSPSAPPLAPFTTPMLQTYQTPEVIVTIPNTNSSTTAPISPLNTNNKIFMILISLATIGLFILLFWYAITH